MKSRVDLSRDMLPHAMTHPAEMLVTLLGGKWKLTIMDHLLSSGVVRFSELRRKFPHISAKTLTRQLRELERDGFISRTIYPVVPVKVEYNVTDLGKSVEHILVLMKDWNGTYGVL